MKQRIGLIIGAVVLSVATFGLQRLWQGGSAPHGILSSVSRVTLPRHVVPADSETATRYGLDADYSAPLGNAHEETRDTGPFINADSGLPATPPTTVTMVRDKGEFVDADNPQPSRANGAEKIRNKGEFVDADNPQPSRANSAEKIRNKGEFIDADATLPVAGKPKANEVYRDTGPYLNADAAEN
jgi:hypothetical protein